MSKYVELGAVQKKIMRMTNDVRGADIAREIGKIPAADVQKVKHGYWVQDDEQGGFRCSECGHATNERMLKWYQEINGDTCNICYQSAKPFYCSRCGAKMESIEGLEEDLKNG